MLMMALSEINSADSRNTFENIYYANRNSMFAYARKVLNGDTATAEDAMQSAFIDAARHIDRLAAMSEAKQKIYLLKAVRSWCFKLISKEKKQRKAADRLEERYSAIGTTESSGLEKILDRMCSRESFEEIVETIRSLPVHYKEVLYLYYVGEESLDAIAAHLGEKYSTVKTRYRRGTELLIRMLQERGIGI